jgi:hypothetical protein
VRWWAKSVSSWLLSNWKPAKQQDQLRSCVLWRRESCGVKNRNLQEDMVDGPRLASLFLFGGDCLAIRFFFKNK